MITLSDPTLSTGIRPVADDDIDDLLHCTYFLQGLHKVKDVEGFERIECYAEFSRPVHEDWIFEHLFGNIIPSPPNKIEMIGTLHSRSSCIQYCKRTHQYKEYGSPTVYM